MPARPLPPGARRAWVLHRASDEPFAGCVGVASRWHRARSPLELLARRVDALESLRWSLVPEPLGVTSSARSRLELCSVVGSEQLRERLEQPLDPVEGPIARAVWSPDTHRLALVATASLFDRWSIHALVDALHDERDLEPASFESRPERTSAPERGAPPRWELPQLDRAGARLYAGRTRTIPLALDTRGRAEALGVEPEDLLAAALHVVLARYGATRWGIRLPRRSEGPHVVGPCEDPVVLDASDEHLERSSLDSLARQWAERRRTAATDPPFAERARGIHEPSCAPLAQVGIEVLPRGAASWLADDVVVPHPLDLSVSVVDGALVIGSREGLLPAARLDAIARHLVATLGHSGVAREAFVAGAGGDRHAWGPPVRWPDQPRTMTESIVAHAEREPEQVVLTDAASGRAITRAELLRRARGWAALLLERGVHPGDRVALAVPPCIPRYEALVGILLAGGVYVPMVPELPAERIATMLDDAGISVVMTTRDAPLRLPDGLERIDVDEPPPDPIRLELRHRAPEDPLYVLYTSGSTGRPKGVINTDAGVRNSLSWMRDWFGLSPKHVLVHKTSIGFDVSGWELLLPLVTPVACVIAQPDAQHDPRALAATMERYGVTWATFVPSTLGPFLALLDRPLPALRHLAIIGEALPGDLVRRGAEALPHARITNLYGPTEAAIQVSAWDCVASEREVPIGHPIANTRLVVRDRWGQPAPPGAVGELEIAGIQVARGYLGRPELDARAFTTGPDGVRRYATGDLAWQRDDGALMFVGRRDGQVKIRGQRIELGEVEVALRSQPGVREAAARVWDEQLVGYVVGDGEESALQRSLAGLLPSGAVPSRIVSLTALPLTASGKLDRKGLPRPTARRTSRAPAEDPRLESVRGVLAEVLGTEPDRLPIDADFFDLGGDSLRALAVDVGLAQRGFVLGARRPTVLHHRSARAIHDALGEPRPALDPLIVPLTRGGGDSALFIVHAAGGRAIAYAPLARQLRAHHPSLDVYGIRASGLYPGEPVLRSVAAMARRYRAAIRAVQPHGPIRLAGWSFGGIVALELARQLEDDGEPPAFVGVIDSWFPLSPAGGRPAQDIDDRYLWGVCNRVYGGLVGREELLDVAELEAMPHDAGRLTAVLERVRERGVFPDRADMERALEVLVGTLHATYDHDHARIYRGPVVGFRSLQRHINAPNPALVWVERALLLDEHRTELCWVEGSHYSCVLEPHVRSLARTLAARPELAPLALRSAS